MPTIATKGCASTSKSGALGASIKVGEFNQFGKRMTLRIDRSEDKGTRLHGIFVAVDDQSGTRSRRRPGKGQFLSTDDPDTILFRLNRAGWSRTRPSSRLRGPWRSTATTCRSPARNRPVPRPRQ